MPRHPDGSGPRSAGRPRTDHGAGMVEYGSVIALIAIVAGVVLTAGIPGRVSGLIDGAVCRVETREGCAEPDGGAGEGDGVDPDDLTIMAPPAPDGGGPPACAPLCEPEPGAVNLADWPEPPVHPETGIAIESHTEFDSVEMGEVSGCDWWTLCIDHEIQRKYRDARGYANGGAIAGRHNASEALHHFLDASGETMEISGEELIDDVPEFEEEVEDAHREIGLQAIREAREQGATGPLTFPVSTEWNSFGYGRDGTGYVYDDADWINTLGSWRYNHTGEVRVFPPDEPGGEWTYEMSAQTNIEKYYDWDPRETDPVVSAGPFQSQFSERDLWNMHRAGMAREFWIEGSHVTTSEGSAP
ncbi:hypothetical protein ACFOVU_26615 [Nocardiopsis sediminis]|uniref:Uncharacterized protein n=1 Tax=Nocardiopsis sediminis TaxID=1778267 RepID=A0ABV8FWH9_9ACTN